MNFLIKRLLYLIDFCQRWKTRIFKDEIIEKKIVKKLLFTDQWIIDNILNLRFLTNC